MKIARRECSVSNYFTHAHFPMRNDSKHDGGPRVAFKNPLLLSEPFPRWVPS